MTLPRGRRASGRSAATILVAQPCLAWLRQQTSDDGKHIWLAALQ